jgi:hypothetical protein
MPLRIPGRIAVPWRRALCGHLSKHVDRVGVPSLRVCPSQSRPISSPAEYGRSPRTRAHALPSRRVPECGGAELRAFMPSGPLSDLAGIRSAPDWRSPPLHTVMRRREIATSLLSRSSSERRNPRRSAGSEQAGRPDLTGTRGWPRSLACRRSPAVSHSAFIPHSASTSDPRCPPVSIDGFAVRRPKPIICRESGRALQSLRADSNR